MLNHSAQQPHIIIAGGGTGGHIFPAIAIANALKKINPTCNILFIGAKGKMEMEKVPEAGYTIQAIDIAGFNRTALWKNIKLPFMLIKSYWQVKKIFSQFKPTAVVGVGGYSSFPVLKFAQQNNIPTYIHESNSFAGKSNILLGKKAKAIFVGSVGMEKFFPKEKITVTGNPIRKQIVQHTWNKSTALQHFKLSEQLFTIFITGGSLGAKSINTCIASILPKLTASEIQIIWQTGKNQYAQFSSLKSKNNWIGEFISDMSAAYTAADLIISRAGAMAISELAVIGKPVIFIPFPFAAEDHQTANATLLVNAEAALMIPDHEISNKLYDTIMQIASNSTLQASLSNNIKQFAKLNADEAIAHFILHNANA